MNPNEAGNNGVKQVTPLSCQAGAGPSKNVKKYVATVNDEEVQIVCRLCFLHISLTEDHTQLSGLMKDMLKIILPEMKNPSRCESPTICNKCLNSLRQSYNFKSTCLLIEDRIQTFVDPKCPAYVDLRQLLKLKKRSQNISNDKVICRLCLAVVKEEHYKRFSKDENDPLRNMVETCFPEITIDLVKDPVICSKCLNLSEDFFHFMMQCLDTEEKINYYCEKKDVNDQLNILDIFLFAIKLEQDYLLGNFDEENDEILRSELFPMELIDYNKQDETTNNGSSSSKKTADIEEDDLMEIDPPNPDTVQSSPSPPPPPVSSSPTTDIIQTEQRNSDPIDQVTLQISRNSEGEEYISSKEDQIDRNEANHESSSNRSNNDNDGDDSDSNILTIKYVDDYNDAEEKRPPPNELKQQRQTVKNTGTYQVDDEDEEFETRKKRARAHKCKLCNFRARSKGGMKIHINVKHLGLKFPLANTKTIIEKPAAAPITAAAAVATKSFNCKSCPFKATDQEEYKKHVSQHEKQLKCPICGMLFTRANFYNKHITGHENNSKKLKQKNGLKTFNFNGQLLTMFKCQYCPYQTRLRNNLIKHGRTHKKSEGFEVYKCEKCNFETIQKENLICHNSENHMSNPQNTAKKCFLCSFQSMKEDALRKHVELVHKSGTG